MIRGLGLTTSNEGWGDNRSGVRDQLYIRGWGTEFSLGWVGWWYQLFHQGVGRGGGIWSPVGEASGESQKFEGTTQVLLVCVQNGRAMNHFAVIVV